MLFAVMTINKPPNVSYRCFPVEMLVVGMKVATVRQRLTSHESIECRVRMSCLLLLREKRKVCARLRGRECERERVCVRIVCTCVDARMSRWRRRSEAVNQSVSR